MIVLQYVQSFFNFGISILSCVTFTILMTGLYTTHYDCLYSYGACSLYQTIEVNAAFCFIIIFLPWVGCVAGLLGSKAGAIIYGIIIFIITIGILVCSSAILADGDMRDTWKTARFEDQLTTNAPEVSGMIIYNICIIQIIFLWFFLFFGAGTTIFAAKKQVKILINSLQQLV